MDPGLGRRIYTTLLGPPEHISQELDLPNIVHILVLAVNVLAGRTTIFEQSVWSIHALLEHLCSVASPAELGDLRRGVLSRVVVLVYARSFDSNAACGGQLVFDSASPRQCYKDPPQDWAIEGQLCCHSFKSIFE